MTTLIYPDMFTRLKRPLTYYGGKVQMLPHLLPNIPAHRVYIEPFFGSGALFWAKEQSESEIINDLDKELINFYHQLRTNLPQLKARIEATPFSRAAFQDAAHIRQRPHMHSTLERAWAIFILANQGFSGMIDPSGSSWAVAKSNQPPKAFMNKKLRLGPEVKARLDLVQMECTDACQVIRTRDCADAFIYADPPYVSSDQGHYKGYGVTDFIELLDTLAAVKGKFILSSYPEDELERFVRKHKWHQFKVKKAVAVTHATEKIKVEVVTANFKIQNPK